MAVYVALLRGINVGGHKRVPMAELKALLADLGYREVRTLVNSGNAVFATDANANPSAIASEIEQAIEAKFGFAVHVVVRTGDDMQAIVAGNPFPEIAASPKQLHVSFLAEPLTTEQQAVVETFDTGDDEYRIVGSNVYLSLPNLLSGASKDLVSFDRKVKVIATSRNWNTVAKLAEMAADTSDA